MVLAPFPSDLVPTVLPAVSHLPSSAPPVTAEAFSQVAAALAAARQETTPTPTPAPMVTDRASPSAQDAVLAESADARAGMTLAEEVAASAAATDTAATTLITLPSTATPFAILAGDVTSSLLEGAYRSGAVSGAAPAAVPAGLVAGPAWDGAILQVAAPTGVSPSSEHSGHPAFDARSPVLDAKGDGTPASRHHPGAPAAPPPDAPPAGPEVPPSLPAHAIDLIA